MSLQNYYEIYVPNEEEVAGEELMQIRFIDTEDRKDSYRLITGQALLDNPPALIAEFAEDAKITNVVKPPNETLGFIVDNKVKYILDDFKFSNQTAFYQIQIVDRRQNHFINYHFLHYVGNLNRSIDYERSKFYVKNILSNDKREIKFTSDEERKTFCSNNIIDKVFPEMIYLSNDHESRDLFKINIGRTSFIVSESLKLSLEKSGVTGVAFRDVDYLTT